MKNVQQEEWRMKNVQAKMKNVQHKSNKLLLSNYKSKYWEQSIAYLQWARGKSPWTSKHKLNLVVNFYCLIKA